MNKIPMSVRFIYLVSADRDKIMNMKKLLKMQQKVSKFGIKIK